jgi:rhodanese-related sulfurtransferase
VNLFRLFQHPKNLVDLTPQALADKLSEPGVLIVDVRTRQEFLAGHLQGARHAPLGKTGQLMANTDRDTPVVLICKTGHRSQAAARELLDLGFTQVHHLAGGIDRWRRQGMPLNREGDSRLK